MQGYREESGFLSGLDTEQLAWALHTHWPRYETGGSTLQMLRQIQPTRTVWSAIMALVVRKPVRKRPTGPLLHLQSNSFASMKSSCFP